MLHSNIFPSAMYRIKALLQKNKNKNATTSPASISRTGSRYFRHRPLKKRTSAILEHIECIAYHQIFIIHLVDEGSFPGGPLSKMARILHGVRACKWIFRFCGYVSSLSFRIIEPVLTCR